MYSSHLPASEHGEVIQRRSTVFLDGHRHAKHHPTSRLLRWDAERLVWQDAGELRHVGNIRLGVVLIRRRSATDDRADGVEAVLMIIGTRDQVEGGTPTIL